MIWVRVTSAAERDANGERNYAITMLEDITERKLSEQRHREQAQLNEHQATHDALTGLGNRRKLYGDVERALGDARAAHVRARPLRPRRLQGLQRRVRPSRRRRAARAPRPPDGRRGRRPGDRLSHGRRRVLRLHLGGGRRAGGRGCAARAVRPGRGLLDPLLVGLGARALGGDRSRARAPARRRAPVHGQAHEPRQREPSGARCARATDRRAAARARAQHRRRGRPRRGHGAQARTLTRGSRGHPARRRAARHRQDRPARVDSRQGRPARRRGVELRQAAHHHRRADRGRGARPRADRAHRALDARAARRQRATRTASRATPSRSQRASSPWSMPSTPWSRRARTGRRWRRAKPSPSSTAAPARSSRRASSMRSPAFWRVPAGISARPDGPARRPLGSGSLSCRISACRSAVRHAPRATR